MNTSELLALLQNVKGSKGQFTARCPSHKDKTNSLSVGSGTDGRILLHCHAGCELNAILDTLSLSPADLFQEPKRTREGEGEKTAPLRSVNAKVQTTPPLRARSEKELQNCKITTPVTPETEVVYLYTSADNEPLFEVVRRQHTDGSKSFRQRRRAGGRVVYSLAGVEPVLYKLPLIRKEIEEGSGRICLCEGEKDAERLLALGLCATTAPMGAGKWRDSYTQALQGAVKVIILPDNDKPGRAHGLRVAGSLQEMGIDTEFIDLCAVYRGLPIKGDVSDVLDHLAGQSDEALRNAIFANPLRHEVFEVLAKQRDEADAIPPYQFASAALYLHTAFAKEVAAGQAGPGLFTGFAALDTQLDGRMYPGLYIVGSVSSLGKTAFCLQMADHMAESSQDVLFFTLEMSRLEMVARSLSRTSFLQNHCLGGFGVGDLLYGRVPGEALTRAQAAYGQKVAKHIAFIESNGGLGVADISALAQRHLEETGRSPVVFVDYLQILRPPDVRMSDKQAMDQAVVELKRLSRAIAAPVVAVSSFNRQNYTEEVNLSSFKESGAIEYSADFVLGLQARGVSQGSDTQLDERKAARMVNAATKKAKQQDPRPLEAVTLKNRRGPAWACFGLDFYPRHNFFIEAR